MAIAQLIEMTRQLTDQHKRLLELAEAKREVVIRDQIEELMKITAEENAIVREISKLELASRRSLAEAGESIGVKLSEEHSLSDLLQALPDGSERRLLAEERQKLVQTLVQLQEINELNRQLIQQSLDYINFNLDLLTDAPEQDLMYQNPTGEQQVKKRTGLFDRKA